MKNYAYLKMIDVRNNNYKFYEIMENDDGTVSVNYGRVGADKPQHKDYGFSKDFHDILWEKENKGYVRDDTHKEVKSTNAIKGDTSTVKYDPIEFKPVAEVVAEFLRTQKQFVAQNYNVKIDHITQKQIDDAKFYLDELRKARNIQFDNPKVNHVNDFNEVLYKEDWYGKAQSECLLFCVERKIKKVTDALLDNPYSMTLSVNEYKSVIQGMDAIVEREQKLIDALEGEYQQYKLKHPDNPKKDTKTGNGTVLDANGLKMEEITYKEEDTLFDLLRIENHQGMENLSRYNSAYKVEVDKTQKRYDDYKEKNHIKDTMLLWHGTTTNNLWSIMTTGLRIMPHAANGRAFGNGLYFANKSQKSANYTSARPNVKNGRTSVNWNSGNEDHGYLALFEVATGKPYITFGTGSSAPKGYDSLWYQSGHGGAFRDDEIIVYHDSACTLKYMVKIDSNPHPRHYHLNPSNCHLDNGMTELVKDDKGIYGVLDITELSDKDRNYWDKKFNTTSADTVKIYEHGVYVNDKPVSTYQDGKEITKDDLWYLFREVKKNFFEKETEYQKATENAKNGVLLSNDSKTNDSKDEVER